MEHAEKGQGAGKQAQRKGSRKWSAGVAQRSDALDLPPGLFKRKSGLSIAKGLKEAAERSTRRKGSPLQSAMSMLNFYINRGGKNLSARRLHILKQAKEPLRHLFGRTAHRRT